MDHNDKPLDWRRTDAVELLLDAMGGPQASLGTDSRPTEVSGSAGTVTVNPLPAKTTGQWSN